MALLHRHGFIKLTIKDTNEKTFINAASIETVVPDPVDKGTLLTLTSDRVRLVREQPAVVISMLEQLGWHFVHP